MKAWKRVTSEQSKDDGLNLSCIEENVKLIALTVIID